MGQQVDFSNIIYYYHYQYINILYLIKPLFSLIFTFGFVDIHWMCWCYIPLSYVSLG